jgi:MATE family multidrug resistance protein
VPLASSYVLISILGVFPLLGFGVLRQSLQALGHLRVLIAVILAANAVNAFLNWVFVYGHMGSPAMGTAGSAWATVVSRWLMFLGLLAFGWRPIHSSLVPFRREVLHLAPLRAMLRLGIPIGLQQFLEFGAFGAIGILMGMLGTTEMAAHQIAINLASLTFMVPVGVGAAAAVRVGHAAGAGDGAAARESARAAVACGVGFMCLTAAAFLLVPHLIAAQYTTEVSVVALASVLIPIAGVFQVFDGIQAVCAGILRGLGDTRAPFVINLLGFWLAGFPVSVLLGFFTSLRAVGLWWGFVAGLGVVAILLLLRVRILLRGEIRRTTIEADVMHFATDP